MLGAEGQRQFGSDLVFAQMDMDLSNAETVECHFCHKTGHLKSIPISVRNLVWLLVPEELKDWSQRD